jgi:hypothetical protein
MATVSARIAITPGNTLLQLFDDIDKRENYGHCPQDVLADDLRLGPSSR